jgi:4,5-dihydroxyphthalate decarboxylase
MQSIGQGTCPYVGIPVFPARAFRHSAIYVRSDSDIHAPEDCAAAR